MAEHKYDPNTLWVALSEYADGNVFQIYPKLLAEILLQDDAARQGDSTEAENLVLPSDKEWRFHQYFRLVSMQKTDVTTEDENNKKDRLFALDEPPEEWAPWNLVLSTKNPNAPPPVDVKTTPGPAWDIGQVLKAARLVCKPPLKVNFADEQEMRCVYSLIYDVFRYKTILNQAIEDVDYFEDYPQFGENRHEVWLFLMELARRRWRSRPRADAERATRLLNEAGSPYKDIEISIWDQRVHLAAAIARIRIKNKAFTLSDLLPIHLRDEKITACVHKETITGWVNTFKTKKVASLVKRLQELGFSYSNSRQLCAGEYRFDRVCPRFITIRPPHNTSIGQLDLVKDGIIVLQEREFCEGASTLCRALRANALQGAVAQTHASSPRCSAYLAAQLRELAAILKANQPSAPATPEIGRLVVFGAGDKADSYVCALRDLGIDASQAPQSGALVYVLSDAVHHDSPVVASALDGVVAVLATPPNSYSSVTDPIDLVCGRGGDLAMLEILTETEMDVSGKSRVQSILEEQKKTLKTLLSKPQIQLILYETHSALEAENQAQVTRAVAEANRLARERHAILRKKHKDPSGQKAHKIESEKETEAVAESSTTLDTFPATVKEEQLDESFVSDSTPKSHNRQTIDKSRTAQSGDGILVKKAEELDQESRITSGTTKARPIPDMNVQSRERDIRDPDKDSADVYVPNCDLFEVSNLPNLGNGLDINYILDRDGCYLGLIQRKEITRLDAKYMICVAEERGLFGGATAAAPRRKRPSPVVAEPRRRRRRPHGFEVERVSAPTYASMSRALRRGSAPACLDAGGAGGVEGASALVCERHARRHAAASAASAAACTCDAKHRATRARRASTDAGPLGAPCRRPFPLAVHDLRLKTVLHANIITS